MALGDQTERYRRPVGIYGIRHKLATLLEGLPEDDAYEIVKSTFHKIAAASVG